MSKSEVKRKPRLDIKLRTKRHAIHVFFFDLILVLIAYVLTYTIRFGPDEFVSIFNETRLPVTILYTLPILLWRRLWKIQPRYMSIYDITSIIWAAGLLAMACRAQEQFATQKIAWHDGWAMPLLFGFLSGTLLGGWRVLRRVKLAKAQDLNVNRGQKRRVLILGASDQGEAVFRELARHPLTAEVIGFADDNSELQGLNIHSAPVLGKFADIPDIVAATEANEILIATNDQSPKELRRIFDLCDGVPARLKLVPPFSSLVSGVGSPVPQARSLDVTDLLRRDQMGIYEEDALKFLAGERVMVTGGGGSIGSEVARQVVKFSPASLILVGKGEGSIFEIDQEIRQKTPFRPVPVIADIRDRDAVLASMKKHSPGVVFHGAAHKHVPLMEESPIEAIRNNIFGTLNVLESAIESQARKFILVSTDKAVKPANVMGATKRVAEMIVASKSEVCDVELAIVRFGNVLGSRGSLVPLICKQIAAGGPVTITHPDMTRYFMTIPEAAQLILQAGAMGSQGEIFVLDMGEAVKILDLIRDIIRMHGLVPGQDVEIKTVGMRPGEKMHEELYFSSESVSSSRHPRIFVAKPEASIPWEWMSDQLANLKSLCDEGNADGARAALMELSWAKNLPPSSMRSVM